MRKNASILYNEFISMRKNARKKAYGCFFNNCIFFVLGKVIYHFSFCIIRQLRAKSSLQEVRNNPDVKRRRGTF